MDDEHEINEIDELGIYGMSAENCLLTYSGDDWVAIEPNQFETTFTFSCFGGEEVFRIEPDGSIHFGENYQPDEAAELFWTQMQQFSPTAMQQQIDKLEAELHHYREMDKQLDRMALEIKNEIDQGIIDDIIKEEVSIPSVKVPVPPPVDYVVNHELVDGDTIQVSHDIFSLPGVHRSTFRVLKPKKVRDNEAYEKAMKVVE